MTDTEVIYTYRALWARTVPVTRAWTTTDLRRPGRMN